MKKLIALALTITMMLTVLCPLMANAEGEPEAPEAIVEEVVEVVVPEAPAPEPEPAPAPEAPKAEEPAPAPEAPKAEEPAPAPEAPKAEEPAPVEEIPQVEESAPVVEAPKVEEPAPAAEVIEEVPAEEEVKESEEIPEQEVVEEETITVEETPAEEIPAVEETAEESEEEAPAAEPEKYVTWRDAPVYKEADPESEIIDYIPEGKVFEMVLDESGWNALYGGYVRSAEFAKYVEKREVIEEEVPAEEEIVETEEIIEEVPAEEETLETEEIAEEVPAEEETVETEEIVEEEIAAQEEELIEIEDYETPLAADVTEAQKKEILKHVPMTLGEADVRLDADGMSEIFATLPDATPITVIELLPDWAMVNVDGQVGFIYKDFVQNVIFPVEEQSETENKAETEKKVLIFSTMRTVTVPGEEITLTGKLIGFEDVVETVSYRWQVNKGSRWEDVSGANEESFTFVLNDETLAYGWRLTVDYEG